jgi:hypothetical protein
MQQITIPLDDQSVARLQELAQRRGETVEQTAQALLRATLPPTAPTPALFAPDDPDGFQGPLGPIRDRALSWCVWQSHHHQ